LQPTAPAGAIAAVSAGSRLDDALRGFLAEQGSKRIHKQALWRLVGGSMRLRLTAHAVSVLPRDDDEPVGPARDAIARRAEQLDAWYDRLAIMLGRPQHGPVEQLEPPVFAQRPTDGNVSDSRPAVWLCEHLDHLTEHLHELVEPAGQLAAIRRRPWWR
jgi:hypothetical protein